MPATTIRLTYRIPIYHDSASVFEKTAHALSYDEFLLKSQVYNPHQQFRLFTQMKSHDGRAHSLHYKTGFSVSGLINTLQEKMPGLTDTIGQPIPFEFYRFELIESDILDRTNHKAAIFFSSPLLQLHALSGGILIFSQQQNTGDTQKIVYSIPLQHQLGITYFEEGN